MPVGFVPGRRAIVTYPLTRVNGRNERRGTVRLWNIDTGRVIFWGSRDDPCTAVAISPRGDRIGVCQGGSGNAAKVYDAITGDQQFELPHLDSEFLIEGMAFSPDGEKIAYTERNKDIGRLRIYEPGERGQDAKSMNPARVLTQLGGRPFGLNRAGNDLLAWSPDGQLLAIGEIDNRSSANQTRRSPPGRSRIHVLNSESGRSIGVFEKQTNGQLLELGFSADGQIVAGVFYLEPPQNNGLCVITSWEVSTGVQLLNVDGDVGSIQPGVPWMIDWGKRGTAKLARVYNYTDSKPTVQVPIDSNEGPVTDGLASDGQTFALQRVALHPVADWLRRQGFNFTWAQKDYSHIRIVNGSTGKVIHRLPATALPGGDYNGSWGNLSSDGKLFAINDSETLRVWDIPPRKSLTWLATGAAIFGLPIAHLARRRVRKLRAA